MTDSGNNARSAPSPNPPQRSESKSKETSRGSRQSSTTHLHNLPLRPARVDHRSSGANMEGGMRSTALSHRHHQHHVPFNQYHHHHHMQPQFAPQPPEMYYPMYPSPRRRPEYSVPYTPLYPPYFQQPLQQPSFQGFPTFMHPPQTHLGAHIPMYDQTSGYGPGYYPSYPMMLGHSPGPPQSPQGYLQSNPQYLDSHSPTTPGTSHFQTEGPQPNASKQTTAYDVSKTIVDGSILRSAGPQSRASEVVSPISLTHPRATRQEAQRKTPKKSGHALWVGNLPPGTNIVQLKDYFSQNATDDIESVFLIAKSNCAFINYKTETTCSAALAKFHDTRFQGVRLVCRLRRVVIPVETGANSQGSSASIGKAEDDDSKAVEDAEKPGEVDPAKNKPLSFERVPNRYFIVKSLTVDDLESSRQSGIWATQTHNEVNLNRAYETADNVYLIFSANKSGGYYGYARMVSPIQEDEQLALEMPPRLNQMAPEVEKPKVTLTQATSTARSGRIIDDPARGTIFWEADPSPEEAEEADAKSEKSVVEPAVGEDATADAGSQTIGRPFRIQWLSTERVPFHRTRGLRNPWNANRGVKIARDGTEIEPGVGAQLVKLFHLPCHSDPGGMTSYHVPN